VGRERARRAEHLHASVSGVDSGPSLWGACARAVLSTCMQADLRPDRNGRSRSQSQSRGQIVTVSRGRAVGASRRQSESESLNPNLNPNLNLNLNLNLNHNLNLEARSYPPLEAEQLAQQLDQRVLGQVADLMRDAIICNQRRSAHLDLEGHQASSGVIRRHQASSGVIGRHRASSGAPGIEAARSRRSW
jgi:hypothetical protein